MWNVIHIIDILLWVFIACSVVYVALFAFLSLLPRRKRTFAAPPTPTTTFLVLYPAYHEDSVIVNSVEKFLLQDYPQEKFQLVVISDHMSQETNDRLAALPLTLLTPVFEKSSKALALQYAVAQADKSFARVVILDADNVVEPDFLSRLDALCLSGLQAIQCHRCAKNSNNDIAMLDGVSEEINNTLFRRAHNNIGLSAALIGSGMCFDFKWFSQNVTQLSSTVEDRELEALMFKQHMFIHYALDIPVYDEKVSSLDNFQRQRLRWMTGQVQNLFAMLPYLPKALATGNIDYIDKTIQQALIPRSILIVTTPLFAVLMLIVHPLWSIKWWVLTLLTAISVIIAIPRRMRRQALFKNIVAFPQLVWRMLRNITKINIKSNDFIHTQHTK